MLKSDEARRIIHVCILQTGMKQDSKWCGSFCCVYLCIKYTYKFFSFSFDTYVTIHDMEKPGLATVLLRLF